LFHSAQHTVEILVVIASIFKTTLNDNYLIKGILRVGPVCSI